MNEDMLDLVARINAIERLVGLAISFGHVNARHTPEQIQQIHETCVETLQRQSLVQGDDPALSDHLSDQVVQHFARILKGVRTLMEGVPPPTS